MQPEIEVLHVHVIFPQPTIRPALTGTAVVRVTFDNQWSILLNDLRIQRNKLDDQQILSPVRHDKPNRMPFYTMNRAMRDEVEAEVWAAFYARLNQLEEQAQAVQARKLAAEVSRG